MTRALLAIGGTTLLLWSVTRGIGWAPGIAAGGAALILALHLHLDEPRRAAERRARARKGMIR